MNTLPALTNLAIDPFSLILGLGLGAVILLILVFTKLLPLERQKAALLARLDSEKAAMGEHFQSLAGAVLKSNTEQFLTLAKAQLQSAQKDGAHDLEKRSQEIKTMVKPVEEHLQRMSGAVEQLSATHKMLREDLKNLNRETTLLAGALRNPAAQGKWGEFVLETILEKSNLLKGVHYFTQTMIESGGRPDVIIHLHDGFKIAIDSKAPVNEYLVRVESLNTGEEIEAAQKAMAASVRGHVRKLGAKSYQDHLAGTDFVILFLPSESVFSAALRVDPDLVDFAAENKVVIASPTLIMSLLRVVGLSWRQVEMAKNAADIAASGAELHKRFSKFLEHFSSIGKAAQSTLKSYNEAVGSMETKLFPQLRKFEKLNAMSQAALPSIPTYETPMRESLAMIANDTAIDEDASKTHPSDKTAHG